MEHIPSICKAKLWIRITGAWTIIKAMFTPCHHITLGKGHFNKVDLGSTLALLLVLFS